MKYKYYLLVFLIFGISGVLSGQGSARKLKSEGDAYFKNQKYPEAANLFSKYQRLKPNDLDARYKLGVSFYYANQLDNSQRYLEYVLDNAKKAKPKTYFYLGRILHSKHQYEKAIGFYKLYLKNTKKNSADRNAIKDAIRRCATALSMAYQEELAVVENLGPGANTAGDEFGPVFSPNYNNKLYFSSKRKGNIGGLRDENGLRDEKFGTYYSDIFSSLLINGRWAAATPMSSLINSPRHDAVLDFNEAGSVLFFYKGNQEIGGDILVDTFSNQADARPLHAHHFDGPMRVADGDNHPYFFNDSTLLFSSYRLGGYGGSDIYVSVRRNGQWQEAENLGPAINSAYDEITPFLSRNGRSLYFSSNNRKSMGGHDIFRSTFDDNTTTWSVPFNLGKPINSAEDDSHMRLADDGLNAYFNSSRKDGMGQRDLYAAYFKNIQSEQQVLSSIPCFTEVVKATAIVDNPTNQPSSNETVSIATESIGFEEIEKEQVTVASIFYTNDTDVLSSSNIRELNKIAKMMQNYPRLDILISCHADKSGPQQFSLFFSIKRSEKISEYLIDNGVAASRIHLKGLGTNYPVAKVETEAGPNLQGRRFNRRIDFNFFNQEGLALEITNKMPDVTLFQDERGLYYQRATSGLSYKVQIAALGQRYNSDIFSSYPDPMIERNAARLTYQYTIGMYKTYGSASQLQLEMVRQGLTDAYVIPYVNGLRVSKEDARGLVADFPDLLNYLKD